jgi:hypothetical protein
MVAVPAATPKTDPDMEPTVATAVLPLVHNPPETRSPNDSVAPEHSAEPPVTPLGVGLTVTVTSAGHPEDAIYEIVAVPAETPETKPVEETVATDVRPLDHVPPVVVSTNNDVAPTHIPVAPVMAAGDDTTATVL